MYIHWTYAYMLNCSYVCILFTAHCDLCTAHFFFWDWMHIPIRLVCRIFSSSIYSIFLQGSERKDERWILCWYWRFNHVFSWIVNHLCGELCSVQSKSAPCLQTDQITSPSKFAMEFAGAWPLAHKENGFMIKSNFHVCTFSDMESFSLLFSFKRIPAYISSLFKTVHRGLKTK